MSKLLLRPTADLFDYEVKYGCKSILFPIFTVENSSDIKGGTKEKINNTLCYVQLKKKRRTLSEMDTGMLNRLEEEEK